MPNSKKIEKQDLKTRIKKTMWKDKLKAIWHLLRSDDYFLCTLRNPKHDSEYMQASWLHHHTSKEVDPYFLSLVEEKFRDYSNNGRKKD